VSELGVEGELLYNFKPFTELPIQTVLVLAIDVLNLSSIK
jgi:hypothetical protein